MEEPSSVGLRKILPRANAILGRYLEPTVIRFVAMTILLLGLIQLGIASWTSEGGQAVYGIHAGGDYGAFYVAGTILNEYPTHRLYDLDLQSGLYHLLLPAVPVDQELPFLYAPFFAVIFQPLSLLPFILSYLVWVAVSICLYVIGYALVRRTLLGLPVSTSRISLLLALSFPPFLFECVIGGNTSAFGFVSVATAVYFERRGKNLASGMALGLCLYKPTWLVLILPMLAVGRKGVTLLGFVLAGLLLAGVSVLTIGWEATTGYLEILLQLSQSTGAAEDVFPTWKFVDLVSFLRLLLGPPGLLTWLLTIAILITAMTILTREWWARNLYGEGHRDLLWACTLTWTTVLSLHVGIYDTIVVVVSVLLTADVLYRRAPDPSRALPPGFRWLVALLYLTPWISQFAARIVGIQALTVVLAAVGAHQLWLATHDSVPIEP